MGYEQQVIANAAAIQALINNSKGITSLPALTTSLSTLDEFGIYDKSNSSTSKATIQDVLDAVSNLPTSSFANDGEDGINKYISLIDIYNGNVFISGGYYNVSNYSYYVFASKYIINNNIYSNSINNTVTLSASDPTNDRIDIIVINSDETISVVEGIASASPIKPNIDNLTQVEVTFILVEANTSSPSGLSSAIIYDENLQEIGGEWDTSLDPSTTNYIDFESTEQFSTGTKSIKNSGGSLFLSTSTPLLGSDYNSISFDLYTTSVIPDNSLSIVCFSETDSEYSTVRINNGNNNYDYNLINTWQTVIIDFSELKNGTWVTELFTKIRLQLNNYGVDIYIDNFKLYSGLNPIQSYNYDLQISNNEDVLANTNARHTHSNKANLDTINQNLATTDSPTLNQLTLSTSAVNATDAVRLDQMNAAIIGQRWEDSVDGIFNNTTALPVAPTDGDRYIAQVTANGWTANNIYEYYNNNWVEFVAFAGMTVADANSGNNYNFNGTNWVDFASTVNHNSLTGLQGGLANEYYHLTNADYNNIPNWNSAYGWGDWSLQGFYNISNFVAGTDYIAAGVGTTNYIPKFTASGVLGNSNIYDDGTNVGIGTTSIQGKFEVFSQYGIYFSRDADPIGQNIKITTDVVSNRIESKGSKPFKIINTIVDKDLILGVNNSNILIIDGSSENVLIDTTDNGVDKLQVNGSTSTDLVKTTNYQSSITTNYTILNTDNGKTLWFDSASAITITIDDTLSDQFECEFINRGAGLVTFASGTATVVSYDGLTLAQGKVATLIKYFATNEYWLKGELA